MKILIVYYSRTGNTKKVAEELSKKFGSDIEELIDTKNRSGIWGWLVAGKEGTEKKLTTIEKPKNNPRDYDLVIVGTPIWVNTPPATRAYLTENSGCFKKVAFFCTMGGSNPEKLFSEMESISKSKPQAKLAITEKEIKNRNYTEAIENFVKSLI